MTIHSSSGRNRRACGATLAALALAAALPLAASTAAQAQRHGPSHMQREVPAAQPRAAAPSPIKAEFHTALEPYGRWQQHARWGEVWTPTNRPRDWRPYTVGRWVYTDDWGWYWIADDVEASWGSVAYHYGRWIFDDELGWCWIPGNEWSPAWVQWRRATTGLDYVGWAPLPPDEVYVDYVDAPRYWVFVRGRDFIAPRLVSFILPVARSDVFIRDTVVVNRTVLVDERGHFAVNPGISPTFIAAATRQPLRSYDVRPAVLAGTAAIAGAMQVRGQDLARRDFRPQPAPRPTQNLVRAAERVAPAQPHAAGERGRLGDMPPRAAQRAAGAPATTGQAPPAQPQGQQQPAQPQRQQQQAQPPQRPQQGQQAQPQPQQQLQPQQQRQQQGQQRQPSPPPQQQAQPQQGRAKPEPAQTQGRGGEPPRAAQPPQRERQQQGAAPQRQPPTAQQQKPVTEGRAAPPPQRPQPQAQQPQRPQPQAQQPQRPQPQAAGRAPAPHGPPTTEGRGGGGGAPHAAPAPRAPGGGGGGPGGGQHPAGGPGGGGGPGGKPQ
jgi:hypothetical protein